MRRLWLLVAFALAGCARDRVHVPTMEADTPETGFEGIALVNQLQSAFKVIPPNAGGTPSRLCDYTLPQHQESETYAYQRYASGKDTAASKFRCIVYKSSTEAGAPSVESHVSAGFALTDLYCDIFFRRISSHASRRRYAGSIVNDVGTAMSAVLGMASAGSVATGIAGAGFGLADAAIRNYDDAFLISADLGPLQDKVYSAQDAFKREALAALPHDYSGANTVILRYANFCTFVGMKKLINESLKDSANGEAVTNRINALRDQVKSIASLAAAPAGGQPAGAPDPVPGTDNGADASLDNAAAGPDQ